MMLFFAETDEITKELRDFSRVKYLRRGGGSFKILKNDDEIS